MWALAALLMLTTTVIHVLNDNPLVAAFSAISCAAFALAATLMSRSWGEAVNSKTKDRICWAALAVGLAAFTVGMFFVATHHKVGTAVSAAIALTAVIIGLATDQPDPRAPQHNQGIEDWPMLDWLLGGDDDRTEDDHNRDVSWLASTWSDSQSGFFSREETAARLDDDD
jgi:hypothetical protein